MLAGIVVLILATAAFAYNVLLSRTEQCPQGSSLPPGPPGLPIIGNLSQIPPYHSWFKFQEWSKAYGPLYRINIAGRNHVIVSTEDIANDLLRERGTIVSPRTTASTQCPSVVRDADSILVQ